MVSDIKYCKTHRSVFKPKQLKFCFIFRKPREIPFHLPHRKLLDKIEYVKKDPEPLVWDLIFIFYLFNPLMYKYILQAKILDHTHIKGELIPKDISSRRLESVTVSNSQAILVCII